VNRPPCSARGLAIPDGAAGVDRRQSSSVRKNDPTAIRNFFWIDRAMTLLQTQSRRRFVLAGVTIPAVSTASPVNGHPRKERIIAGKAVIDQG
jgi:hypothetical protein